MPVGLQYHSMPPSMKKSTPGVEATSHRIEASRVVRNTLERPRTEEDLKFLKPAADNALGLLQFVRVGVFCASAAFTHFR